MPMLQTIVGDTHVHVPYVKDGTTLMVRGAIERRLDFVVLAYHDHISRFDEIAESGRLGKQYYRSKLGNAVRVNYMGGFLYCIKGQQISPKQGIDLLAWPVTEEISPGGKDLGAICGEIRRQGGIVVLPHPRKDKEEEIRGLFEQGHITAVEYSCAPKILVKESNEFAGKLAVRYKVPLIAGSDARKPDCIMPCTRLKKVDSRDIKRFGEIGNADDFLLYLLEEMVNGHVEIDPAHANIARFARGYASYAASALRSYPLGTVKSFFRSHL